MNREILEQLDKKYKNSDAILGKNVMTLANRSNSSRALMVSGQGDQTVVLEKPEFAAMSTNYEKLVSQYSSAFYKAGDDYEIIDKIVKFEDNPDHLYTLIVYNKTKKMYDIIVKQHGEKLTESYGFLYDNKVIDAKDIGDTIDKGEVLYKSTSFDDHMNYRYGINALTMYTLDDRIVEDAIVVSETLAEKLTSVELEPVRVSLNDNDILINLYGKQGEYKSFPDIGKRIKEKVLCSKRRIVYSQALFDLKKENMNNVNYKIDKPYYIHSYEQKSARVVDINIYCNKDISEIPDTVYNSQIIKYLKNEMRYHQEIVDKLGAIINSGKKYSTDIFSLVYKRSLDILDPTIKWKDSNNSIFNNIIIEFLVERKCGIKPGSKLCGRYGDKGVVSAVVPDHLMPKIETGRHVEMICSILGVPNRLNPGQLYEVTLNFEAARVREQMEESSDINHQAHLLFKFLRMAYEKEAIKLEEYYGNLDDVEKEQFIQSILDDRIYVVQPPMYGNITLEQIQAIRKEFNIKPYKVYLNKFGRQIKLMNDMIIGEKYVLKLKHTPHSKFSARSTGYLNSKDLPFKSSENNKTLYQKTPTRWGEQNCPFFFNCGDIL